jgi:hypothetical protein
VDSRATGKRLREVLAELTADRDSPATWDDVAASLSVDKKTLDRWFQGENLPRIGQLYAIGQRTGCSADWVLGFSDVARRRGDESQREVGTVLRAKLQQIESAVVEAQGSPSPGSASLIPLWRKRLDPIPESPGELVEAAAYALLELRLGALANRWLLKIRELAARMRSDSAAAQDSDERKSLIRIATELDFLAMRLDSSEGVVESLNRLEAREPLFALSQLFTSKRGDEALETPFAVLGSSMNCGLAWRGAKHDDVWCIRDDPTNEIDLALYVRRRGRFLVEPVESESGAIPQSKMIVRHHQLKSAHKPISSGSKHR